MAPTHMVSDHDGLRPEDVSFCDLLGILTSRKIAESAYAAIPSGMEENPQQRWFLFLSLSGQKLLQVFKKPLSQLGTTLEKWLNILSSNRSLCNLLLGKEAVPEIKPDNPKYLSFIGHLDRRVELDPNIKHGDSRYYAMLCAMASKLSYENRAVVKTTVEDIWKMELLGIYDFYNEYQGKRTTQGFMFHDRTGDSDTIIIAFRGTEPFDADAWCTDIDITWIEFPGVGKIHGGFMKALGLVSGKGWPPEFETDSGKLSAYSTINEKLRKNLEQNRRTKFIVTGHSLGGALAILFPAVLAMHKETWLLKRLEAVYTFGQPRVGDREFKKYMEKQLHDFGFKYLRFVYCNDLIPRLPHDDSTFLFKHFGTCLYYNGCYRGEVVEEEPDKNYVSVMDMILRMLKSCWKALGGLIIPYKEVGLRANSQEEEPDQNYESVLAVIPRFLNACWELLRSFIMPYMFGPDFAETGLLKFFRLVGLLFPGIADHNPRDYVNLARLGSPDIIIQASKKTYRKISSMSGELS